MFDLPDPVTGRIQEHDKKCIVFNYRKLPQYILPGIHLGLAHTCFFMLFPNACVLFPNVLLQTSHACLRRALLRNKNEL